MIERSESAYLFEGLTGSVLPEDTLRIIRSLLKTENLYLSAIREITTKLEILNDEFRHTKDRSPIHQIITRVKSPKSIFEKLKRRGFEFNEESARKHIYDIAGIRVICPYINDIYLVADLLTSQDDIELIQTRDYIKKPKSNGYRSLHQIITVPVFLSDHKEIVHAEIQIRTIAMDFWASLEHDMAYKLNDARTDYLKKELKSCADVITDTDIRMQDLFNKIHTKI